MFVEELVDQLDDTGLRLDLLRGRFWTHGGERLDFATLEVIPLPGWQPFIDTLLQILRVGIKLDVARLLEQRLSCELLSEECGS